MILFQDNFLNDTEIKFILDKWNESIKTFSNYAVHFYSVNLLEEDLSKIHHGNFSKVKFDKIRLQKYDETFTQTEEYHGHENIHNYIIFLNDGFEGGELEFENGLIVKPKKGGLIYFNNNERHRVHSCKGDRFVLTFLGDEKVELKLKTQKTDSSLI